MEDSNEKPKNDGLENSESSPTSLKELIGGAFGGGALKRILVTMQEARVSLFGSIAPSMIMEEQKTRTTKQKNLEDMLCTFPDLLPLWKDLVFKLTKDKPSSKSIKEAIMVDLSKSCLSQSYPVLLSFFTSLVSKLEALATVPPVPTKLFSDELIYLAAVGIYHTNSLILETLAQCLDASEIEAELKILEGHFISLRTFQEFFFALTKLKCNTILHEKHLAVLQDSTKMILSTLQLKVQSNFKLLLETPVQARKLQAIATVIYYVMQTVAVLSVFGEPEILTAGKYQNILERFKTIFALVSQSAVFDKILCEQYDFELVWSLNKGKYMLNSFNQKRLSIYVQEDKHLAEEPIEFSLKYVVVYYNYKILKLISQRLQINYDEHILNVFSTLIHKNRSLVGGLISQKGRQNAMKVMLHLNENIYIIKSYIVNLAYFSDNLDPMQRQAKYDTIKDTTIDCLSLAIKSGMYWKPKSTEDVNMLSIFEPKDFVALLFKALLLYKKVRERNASTKFVNEMMKHVNVLATDLVSRPITTDDMGCFYSYRLYFLQFLSQWDLESLKEKYMKYSEEMSRYLADFDEDDLETDIIKQLKFRCQELALELYVKMAQIDCFPPIEAIISFIRESFTSKRKLNKYFYIMICLLFRKKISLDDFRCIMEEASEPLSKILGSIQASPETDAFIQKEGMGVLFLIYKNTACSFVQTKEQRKAYEMEINEPFIRKSIATAEVNNYVTKNYIKKLDVTVQAYDKLLKSTETFICALHYSVPIAEDFLVNPEFDQDFYEKVIHMPSGRSLILKLLGILSQHLLGALKKTELIEKFTALSIDVLMSLDIVRIPFAEEKSFVLTMIGYLEKLLLESGGIVREVREICFHKAILAIFLEICQKKHYCEDVECFLRFMRLLKLVVKDNRLFYESPETKTYVYSFVLSQFDSLLEIGLVNIEMVQRLLQYLLDISLEMDFDIANPLRSVLIHEPSAIEGYFQILVKCFRLLPLNSNTNLKTHVLSPLEALSNSLMNDCILSKVSVQELLMKIMKRASDKSFQKQISGYIGRISSTHTTSKHIQTLMRHFIKNSKYVPAEREENYFLVQLDTLIDAISGDSMRSIYFFSGNEKSFIRLKTPLKVPTLGLFWTGHVRYERGHTENKQCIFSFLKIQPNEVKGVELYIHNQRLVYKLVRLYKGGNSVMITLPHIEIREDSWHHITMAHIGNELWVYMDGTPCMLEMGVNSFAREYNCAIIGAATDPNTYQQHSFFFGEMSTLYFFSPTPKFKEVFKDLAQRGQYLQHLYRTETPLNDNLPATYEQAQGRLPKYMNKEFLAGTHFVLDPKYNVFNKLVNEDMVAVKGKSMNMIESLQETQLFFNRPAKDVFHNLGGFKAALPLLANRILFTKDSTEHDAKVCCSILKLLHALCLNNEVEVMYFLIVENGIDILKHLFEKVGKHGKFTEEFVKILFEILELPVLFTSRLSRIVPALLEKVVFNIRIWSNSEYSVQKKLMERTHELLKQKNEPLFSNGQPYKGILLMLYDYFATEEVDDPELKKFLIGIRWELTQTLIDYFNVNAKENTVPTLVEFLLPRPDYWYSIRDLLYIIMLYQSSSTKTYNIAITNYLKEMCKAKKKEFDLVAALHILINNAIVQKATLFKSAAIEDPVVVKNRIDCCDHVISYCIHILLSFNWASILEHDTGTTLVDLITGGGPTTATVHKQKSPVLSSLNTVFAGSENFLTYLNPGRGKGKFVASEEIVLHFLFHRLNPNSKKKESYEKGFLGEKTYSALLSHLTPEPSLFYLKEKELQQRLLEMSPAEWDTSRNRLLYGKILENLRVFEPLVQQKILLDCRNFLGNKGFNGMFTRMDNVFEAICGYLSKAKYIYDPMMKKTLEKFYLVFIIGYWREKRGRSGPSMFRDMWNFQVPEFLYIANILMDTILRDPSKFATDESICSAIQFAYFLEDAALRIPSILTQSTFIEIIGKLIVYLNELRILYFWYPSFMPGHIPKELHFDFDEYSQREGGLVRVILKLLFGTIIKTAKAELDEAYKKLPLKLLSFFVFRRAKTLKNIKDTLNIQLGIPSDITSFLEYTSKHSVPSVKVKLISHNKAVAHQKSVEDITRLVKKDPLDSGHYRALLLYTELVQVLTYTAFDVTSYRDLMIQLKKPDVSISYRLKYLAKMLGKVVKVSCGCGTSAIQKALEDLGKEFVKAPEYPIEMCISNFDGYSKEIMDTMRPYSEYSSQTSGKAYSKPATISFVEKLEGDSFTKFKTFQDDTLKIFSEVSQSFADYKNKKLTIEAYAEKILHLVASDTALKNVQPGLHRITTEDFLQIEKMVLGLVEGRPKVGRRVDHPKIQSKEDKDRISKMQKLVQECNKKFTKSSVTLNPDAEKNRGDKEYEDLKKRVLSEFAFSVQNRENEKIYGIVEKYYRKLLARCPLNKHNVGQRKQSPFKSFVKLNLARDNIGRAMRLKEIKHPLKNQSILRGISYVRQFLIKRFLIVNTARRESETNELSERECFLVPNQYQHKLLKALTEKCVPKARLSILLDRQKGTSITPSPFLHSHISEEKPESNTPGGYVIKTCVSRTQLASECKVKLKSEKITFQAALVKIDHSTFGVLRLSDKEIVFSNKSSNINKPEYRLGPTSLMYVSPTRKMKKTWRYSDITRIMARNYNMTKQAIEIQFVNHKSVLLVLFSSALLEDFFKDIETLILNNSIRLSLVKDCKKEFMVKKYTEEWRKKKLTNFEYLMLINDYASRSFECMSQYPIFPWILQDLSERKLQLATSEFRDLKLPIAGITQRKREEAMKKYDNTDDFPGGRFQFGSHYLPGRAVLGYLMRIQPYTLMIYRFDSGGDCPSRHFHKLEVMWNNIKIQCDNNLELIPEFYYLPEFLANQ